MSSPLVPLPENPDLSDLHPNVGGVQNHTRWGFREQASPVFRDTADVCKAWKPAGTALRLIFNFVEDK